MKRAAALALVGVALLVGGCGGGAEEEDVASLEARVAELESRVAQLESETELARELSRRLDQIEGFIQDARDRLAELGEIRELLETLAELGG